MLLILSWKEHRHFKKNREHLPIIRKNLQVLSYIATVPYHEWSAYKIVDLEAVRQSRFWDLNIQSVFKMLGQTSGVFPTTEQGKKLISIYVRRHIVFAVQPNNMLTSVTFLCVGTLKNLSVCSSNRKWGEASPTKCWCISIHDSTCSDVSMRALIKVEDILSICCELWLCKQQQYNSYY
jgi:hypothetical protein